MQKLAQVLVVDAFVANQHVVHGKVQRRLIVFVSALLGVAVHVLLEICQVVEQLHKRLQVVKVGLEDAFGRLVVQGKMRKVVMLERLAQSHKEAIGHDLSSSSSCLDRLITWKSTWLEAGLGCLFGGVDGNWYHQKNLSFLSALK